MAVARWFSRSFQGTFLTSLNHKFNIHRKLSVSVIEILGQIFRKATHNHLSEVRNHVCLSLRKLAMPRGGTSHSLSLRIHLLIYIAAQFDLPFR